MVSRSVVQSFGVPFFATFAIFPLEVVDIYHFKFTHTRAGRMGVLACGRMVMELSMEAIVIVVS